MSKDLKFNFCIIPNPFSNGSRNMIFISKLGDNFLDRNIIENKEYQDIKEVLEKFGYSETGHLQFESSNNSSNITELNTIEIKEFLENCGLLYSRELEVNVVKELTNIKNETDRAAKSNLDFIYGNEDFNMSESPIEEKTRNKLIESKSELFEFKHKEPEIGESINLNFYLFLEFGFNQFGRPIIQFGGDFKDSEDHDDRNYIKIVESEFKRVSDPKKPNAIVFTSTKTQDDFLKEVGILYSGYFKYQRHVEKLDSMIVQEKKYPYKLADIKKFLDPKQSIVVETNRMGFDRLIILSNKIKIESIAESNQHIPTVEIEAEAVELIKFLTKRMHTLSENEDFEGALKMKKDIDFIKNQVDYVKALNKKEITTEEYFKFFSTS